MSIPTKLQLSREGAEQLRQFVPQVGHEAMYDPKIRQKGEYKEYHWRMPSEDGIYHPVYFGRNIDGEWFLLTIEPKPENPQYVSYYTDINQVHLGAVNVARTLQALAFTIIACELMRFTHFYVKGSSSLAISSSLQKYINIELSSAGEERARKLTDVEDPMWSVPSHPKNLLLKDQVRAEILQNKAQEDLTWASHIDLHEEIKAIRTYEKFGSFMANHGNLRDQTSDFVVSNGDGTYQYPTKLNLRILRLLVSGNIYPINGGYAFKWHMPTYRDVLFLSDADPRLEDIKAMRLRNLELMREFGDSAIRIKEGIEGTPFSILDEENTSLTDLTYKDNK
jgi:hypothetical protein